MKRKRNILWLGLGMIAGMAFLLWTQRRLVPVPVTPPVADPVTFRPPPGPIDRRPRPPAVRPEFLVRYALPAQENALGTFGRPPARGVAPTWTDLIEPPVGVPGPKMAESVLETFVQPLPGTRWTSEWNDFLERWVDPWLTRETGLGLFRPDATFESLPRLPQLPGAGFSVGIKYRWTF